MIGKPEIIVIDVKDAIGRGSDNGAMNALGTVTRALWQIQDPDAVIFARCLGRDVPALFARSIECNYDLKRSFGLRLDRGERKGERACPVQGWKYNGREWLPHGCAAPKPASVPVVRPALRIREPSRRILQTLSRERIVLFVLGAR
jgi:hypothetical protein